MRLSRMTTRRWMVAVAVVALLMGIVGEVIRELRLTRRHHEWANGYRLAEAINRGDRVALPGGMTVQSAGSPRLADYYAEMRWKYERASRYPWLSVEPDPPQPEP
jgi:hypothetical protein